MNPAGEGAVNRLELVRLAPSAPAYPFSRSLPPSCACGSAPSRSPWRRVVSFRHQGVEQTGVPPAKSLDERRPELRELFRQRPGRADPRAHGGAEPGQVAPSEAELRLSAGLPRQPVEILAPVGLPHREHPPPPAARPPSRRTDKPRRSDAAGPAPGTGGRAWHRAASPRAGERGSPAAGHAPARVSRSPASRTGQEGICWFPNDATAWLSS